MSVAAEHDRMLGNAILVGVVAELDEAAARVKVDVAGMRTDWIPWTERAGPGVRTWSAPEVGSQVVVVCPYGDPAQGVVVAGVYRDAYPAPASAKTAHRVEFADGSVVEYDRDAHKLTIDVGSGSVVVNCATATITATDSVTVDTPTAHFTGDVHVDKGITAGEDITTPAEVKAGDIGLKAHHHEGVSSGSASTTPSVA